MATTVGATLASSKLAVTQGDLHLIGSPVDQLVLYFDQAAFDKFLATARVKANKPKKLHRQARTTDVRHIPAASVWSRIGRPAGKIGKPEGPSHPQLGARNIDHHGRRQRDTESPEPPRRRVRHHGTPRGSAQPAAPARSADLKARPISVPSPLKGVRLQATSRASASPCRSKEHFERKNRHVPGDAEGRQGSHHQQKDGSRKAQTTIISGLRGDPKQRSGASATEGPCKRSVFDRLSFLHEPQAEKRRHLCGKVVSANVITRSRYRSDPQAGQGAPPPRVRQPRGYRRVPTASDAHSALADSDTVDSAAENEMTTYMVADARPSTSSPPGPQGPPPTRTEETIRHLADSVAHLTGQLQTMQERLDRQD